MIPVDADRYLDRIGLDAASVADPALGTLGRLQRAHVRTVPFETLAITGDPFGRSDGAGVTLDEGALYEKVVERDRGGFCYELNGLFARMLADLGFDVARYAGRVLGDDGDARPPANHLVPRVRLDREYVVDVGTGVPKPRRPIPVDGSAVTDARGVDWRVVPSGRPDADRLLQYRLPAGDRWKDRYVYTERPRDLSYFAATCEFLQSAPESPFTDDPTLAIATDDGYAKLSGQRLTWLADGEKRERTVDEDEWFEVLADTFGIEWP